MPSRCRADRRHVRSQRPAGLAPKPECVANESVVRYSAALFGGAGLQVTLQAAMGRASGKTKTSPETKTKESTSRSTIKEAPAAIRTLSPNTAGTQVLAPRNRFAIRNGSIQKTNSIKKPFIGFSSSTLRFKRDKLSPPRLNGIHSNRVAKKQVRASVPSVPLVACVQSNSKRLSIGYCTAYGRDAALRSDGSSSSDDRNHHEATSAIHRRG
jgi:hypothetical protein